MSMQLVPASTADDSDQGLRAEFREFVDSTVAPYADEFDRSQHIPQEVLQAVAERGYWGAGLPVSAGGSGWDLVTLGELHEEVGRGCSSVRSLLTVHHMVAAMVTRWGSEPVRTRWLAALAAGDALGAFCLTEPEAGSDASAVAATARPCPGGYRLTGTKRWITAGQVAHVLLVFARTERGLTAFLVPADNPGVRRVPIRDVLGTRGSMLAEVQLDGVHVAADAVLGREGAGLLIATSALELGRYSVANGCVGILQAALDACVSYTSQRRQGGVLLLEHQLVRQMVSDMVTDVRAARLLCRQAGQLMDAADPSAVMATWVAKYHASTSATRCASNAVQLHGANGCGGHYGVARLFRDAKVMEVIEGSTQIQQVTIADFAYQRVADPGPMTWPREGS
jgi:methoxymalonate biosynthesis protein